MTSDERYAALAVETPPEVEAADGLLDRIAEEGGGSARHIELPSGYSVEVEAAPAEAVRVRAPGGQLLVTVELTSTGLKLRLEAAELEIAASERLSLHGKHVHVEASESLELTAPRTRVIASRSDLGLKANDSVDIVGEQILLNSDKRTPPPPWLSEQLGARHVDEPAHVRVPRQDVTGDAALLDELASGES